MNGTPSPSNCPLTYQRTSVNSGIQDDWILFRSCADNCNSYEFMVMLVGFFQKTVFHTISPYLNM